MSRNAQIKHLLGELPFAVELYWQLRQSGKPPRKKFSLQQTEQRLPLWVYQASRALSENHNRGEQKRVFLFSTLRLWIEHSTLLSVALAGWGHQVTFTFLPYYFWHKPLTRFDLRRQNIYFKRALGKAAPLVQVRSLLDFPTGNHNAPDEEVLPEALVQAIQYIALRDTQYTLQIEEVDTQGEKTKSGQLFQFRLQRNLFAARTFYEWLQSLPPEQRPEVVILPNGSILEMGALYQTARYLGLNVVTYEFGEQRGRIWLAKNDEVMLQDTQALWQARQGFSLQEKQWQQMRDLTFARQSASLWNNFYRRWQALPSQGGGQAREALHLDDRPVFLLAANVLADSLTLGRQVFSENMTQWIQRTVTFFAEHPEAQLIVRMHPGERYTKGPSVSQVIFEVLPQLPENIRLVHAQDAINTYDLIEIADIGLVYTTTVGLEMAMSGLPVIVAGKTHYRGKGFTLDAVSWENYYTLLNRALHSNDEFRLSREQIEQAWSYAYLFFFEYPLPFPWHLKHFWREIEEWSIARVLSDEGMAIYGETFRLLTGKERDWSFTLSERLCSSDAEDVPLQTPFEGGFQL